MEQLIEEVRAIVDNEYIRASDKFGPFHNSDHEAAAVTLEELDEASEEMQKATEAFYTFWTLVKDKSAPDEAKLHALARLKHIAVFAACEMIQVSAMALKSQKTIEERQK